MWFLENDVEALMWCSLQSSFNLNPPKIVNSTTCMFSVVIDLTMVFDIVSKEGFWKIHGEIWLPEEM